MKKMVMRKVGTAITEEQFNKLQKLVEMGEYGSISEAVRDAVRQLLRSIEEQGLIK